MIYENCDKQKVNPKPSSFLEAFRAIGYSLNTAVADIIDNSISAEAKNIWINSEWKGADSVITIKDDGEGMNAKELIDALTPGILNPLDERDKEDLGRFGLGLKTASFSQCRLVSVISKRKGYHACWYSWDLDYIARCNLWELLNYIPEEYEHALDDVESGTMVIWTKMDRIIPSGTDINDKKVKDKFQDSMSSVKDHVSQTFHRFISEEGLKIHFWGHETEAWDPFMQNFNLPSLQPYPEETLSGGVKMKGYVLPHKERLTSEQYKYGECVKGWNQQQGFYVYRGRRLIISGGWLRLFRVEEHVKLARIRIDLPNTVDSEWQIDVKKSKASIPIKDKERIKAYAMRVRRDAIEVFRHVGKRKYNKLSKGRKLDELWTQSQRGLKWFYKINRDHILIKDIIERAEDDPRKAVDELLRLIEETLPAKQIFIEQNEREEDFIQPFENKTEELIQKMQKIYDKLIEMGVTPEKAKAQLASTEPFNSRPELIEENLINHI